MGEELIRVGTTYLPVIDVDQSAKWYVDKLEATLSYQDDEKAIINFANQSFFLVKAKKGENANFIDEQGRVRFSQTFEVDGLKELESIHQVFSERGIKVGAIEDRGHPGRNFVFYDPNGNIFDVWSELSPQYKNSFLLTK